MDLILYNYCTSQISNEVACKYLDDLLHRLRSQGVHVESIRLHSGNELHPTTHKLIGKILEFWYSRPNQEEPTRQVQSSFYFLQRHLQGKATDDFDFTGDSGEIRSQLVTLLEANQTPPTFFHSILITGDKYKLEYPYGVALPGNSDVGGICVNANLTMESIWHETAHLLGAQDHYDGLTQTALAICTNPSSCLMRWNSLEGSAFCSQSIAEMNHYMSNSTS